MTHDDFESKYKERLAERPYWLGISVQDGWLPIVDDLFERIEREFDPAELDRLKFVQIKQKFAELRVYYRVDGAQTRVHLDAIVGSGRIHQVTAKGEDAVSPRIDALIRVAQERAAKTCERCGAPGRRVNDGRYLWIACEEHFRGP